MLTQRYRRRGRHKQPEQNRFSRPQMLASDGKLIPGSRVNKLRFRYAGRVRASSSTGLNTQRLTLGALSRQRRLVKGMPLGGGQQMQWSQLPAADQPASD